MPSLPKAGAQLELDTSQWDSAYKGVMADAGKLDALDPTVKVTVNDADLKTAIDLAADLDTSTSLSVNVNDTELTSASDKLDAIATIGAIDLAINIAGTAKGFFDSLGKFSGVGGLMELDTALASIEGRTGRMIPDAEKLITDLYVNGWGESRTAIANTIVEATNLKIANEDLAEATESAFHVQAVTGGDTNEILRTMDSLVKNGLVPSYTEAADLITTGFQTGNDRGQDLLDTFNEYGSTFQNLKISGPGALALINSGLDAGVDNSDRIADAIRETGIRLGEIGTNEDITTAFERLDSLSDIDLAGTLDAFNAGELSGDEFFAGFFTALGDAVEADPVEAQVLAATLVGTIAEDFGTESIAQLSPVWDETMGSFEGRAETAANTISDTLGVTVDTFLRNIEQMAVDFLESDAIDLDGKIETFKTQLQTAMTTAMNGGSLGDALEVGFGITGVDAALKGIERVFGHLVLALLEIVASIQDPTGLGNADEGTRKEIARLAGQQLPFDLKLANADEIPGILFQAFERNVDTATMGSGIETAINELIAAGDYSKAIDIVSAFQNLPGMTPEAIQAFSDKYITPLSGAFDDAIASGDFDVAKKIADAQGDPTAYTDAIKGKFGFDAAAFDQMAADFATGMETAIIAENPTPAQWFEGFKPTEEVTTAISDFDTDVTEAMNNVALVTALANDEMLAALGAMSDGVVTADEEIAYAVTGNTMTTSFETMAASAETNAAATKASFMGILATVSEVDTAMSAFFNGIMARVSAVNNAIEGIGTVPSGGGGGSTTNNNITVNQTTNTQSTAQAEVVGYRMAAQIRGMA